MEISLVKISELSNLTGVPKTSVSRFFKDKPENVVMKNNRIIGITPEGVSELLKEHSINNFFKPAVILSANLCGGVGKTSGIHSLSACARRIVDRTHPIVIIDTDSQGSFTSSVFGSPARDEEPILIDFLDGKSKIEQIMTNIGDNIWFIKSNLNQAYIDKILSKPSEIKYGMFRLYTEIFKFLGEKTKIFQDHTPQLSSIFASSICGLSQLDENIIKAIVIPMRTDHYAVDGAEKILDEVSELQETFSLSRNIKAHCFFSSIDKRLPSTKEAIQSANKKEKIIKNLSPVVIRYCAEIPKSIQSYSNIYTNVKTNKAKEDYQELLRSIFCYENE